MAPFKIFTPDDSFVLVWTFVILLITILNIVFIPYELSFLGEDRENQSSLILIPLMESLFILDILINFRTAYYSKGVLMTDTKSVFKKYLRSQFFFDAFAMLADIISVALVDSAAWYIKILVILRIKKLAKLFNRIEDFLNLDRSYQAILKMIRLWATILIVAHFIACAFHLVAW